MNRVTLGSSDLGVSNICLGAMYLGSKVDEKASFGLLDRYAESGGNFVDTSNNYAFWIDGCVGDESELTIGKWMLARQNRNALVVATKVGARPTTFGGNLSNGEGLSARSVELAIEQSLRRLNTDRIDLYYAHVTDDVVPLAETLGAFDRIIQKGKVRAIACSNHRAYQVENARFVSRSLGLHEYVAIQQRYSFLRPKPFSQFVGGVQIVANEDLLELCEKDRSLSLLAYSPLLGGIYNSPEGRIPEEYNSPDSLEDLKRLRKTAKEMGVTPNQLVLAWMMNGKNHIIPVVAASNLNQLSENLAAESISLSKEDVQKIGWWG